MRLKNPFKHDPPDPNEIRRCKKCGTELASDSKYKLCTNCREERARKIKEVAIGVGTTAAMVVAVLSGIHRTDGGSYSDDDYDGDDDGDEYEY